MDETLFFPRLQETWCWETTSIQASPMVEFLFSEVPGSSTGWGRGRGRAWSLSPGQFTSQSSPLQTPSSQRLGIDATFKVTPGNYQQQLIVNARIGGMGHEE